MVASLFSPPQAVSQPAASALVAQTTSDPGVAWSKDESTRRWDVAKGNHTGRAGKVARHRTIASGARAHGVLQRRHWTMVAVLRGNRMMLG